MTPVMTPLATIICAAFLPGNVGPSGLALGPAATARASAWANSWSRWGRPSAPKARQTASLAHRRAVSNEQHGQMQHRHKKIGEMSRPELNALFEKLRGRAIEERIDAWSRLFLNTPYALDPLGEGQDGEVDKDPMIDLTRVDCVTLVEQVMAFAYADEYEEAMDWLKELRYHDGRPAFENRYYTMIKGWILAHRRAGMLRDVTEEVAGKKHVERISVSLRPKRGWHKEYRRRFELMGKLAPKGRSTAVYIPIRRAIEIADQLPAASLMHIVAERSWRSPYLVTHTGLIVEKKGRKYFRHASRSPERRRVEDRPLADYLKMLYRYTRRNGRRRALGVNLTKISDPSAETNPSSPNDEKAKSSSD